MVYIIQDHWVFRLCPFSGILKNTTFTKLDLFPSPGERVGDTYFVGSLANFSHQTRSTSVYRTMDKVRNPSNPECLLLLLLLSLLLLIVAVLLHRRNISDTGWFHAYDIRCNTREGCYFNFVISRSPLPLNLRDHRMIEQSSWAIQNNISHCVPVYTVLINKLISPSRHE
jgi:hypothetical protein